MERLLADNLTEAGEALLELLAMSVSERKDAVTAKTRIEV